MNDKSTETNRALRCRKCGRIFNCPSAITNHRKVRDVNKFSCKYCCGSFIDAQQRSKHHKKFHPTWPEVNSSVETISDEDKIFYHITGAVPPPIQIIRDSSRIDEESEESVDMDVDDEADQQVEYERIDIEENEEIEEVLEEPIQLNKSVNHKCSTSRVLRERTPQTGQPYLTLVVASPSSSEDDRNSSPSPTPSSSSPPDYLFFLQMLLLQEPTQEYLQENQEMLSLLFKKSKVFEDWGQLFPSITAVGVLPFTLLLFDSIKTNGLDFALQLYNNATIDDEEHSVHFLLKYGVLISFYSEISKPLSNQDRITLVEVLKKMPKFVAIYFKVERFLKLISKLSVGEEEESCMEHDPYYREKCILKESAIEKLQILGKRQLLRKTQMDGTNPEEKCKIWTEMLNKLVNNWLSITTTQISLYQICLESTISFPPLSKPFVRVIICQNLPTCRESDHVGFDLCLHSAVAKLKVSPQKEHSQGVVKVSAEDLIIFLRLFYDKELVNVAGLNECINSCCYGGEESKIDVEKMLLSLQQGTYCSFSLYSLTKAVQIQNPMEFLNLERIDWKHFEEEKRSDLFKIYKDVYGQDKAFSLVMGNAHSWCKEAFITEYLDELDGNRIKELFSTREWNGVEEIVVYDCLKDWSVRKTQPYAANDIFTKMVIEEKARQVFQSVCECIRVECLGRENHSRVVNDFFLPVDILLSLEGVASPTNEECSVDNTPNKKRRIQSKEDDEHRK